MAKIISGEIYKDLLFDGQDLRAMDLSECECTHCSFIGCDLTDAKLNSSKYTDCSFENAKLSGANLFDVSFIGCKLSGIDFSNKTKILATVFDNCLLNYTNFTAVDLSSIKFDKCSCIEINFTKSNLEKTVFENCLIQDCQFSRAHFDQTDFHTSTLSGLDIYEDKMRGIILSPSQFLSLASEIGISIVE